MRLDAIWQPFETKMLKQNYTHSILQQKQKIQHHQYHIQV